MMEFVAAGLAKGDRPCGTNKLPSNSTAPVGRAKTQYQGDSKQTHALSQGALSLRSTGFFFFFFFAKPRSSI